MSRKTIILVTSLILFSLLNPQFTVVSQNPGQIYEGEIPIVYRNVTVYAPAVASTDDGYVGVISTITVTIQNNGSGRVFVDTLPLTQVDMQGSARLAVKVASTLVKNDENCDVDPSNYDYFFVVRTDAPIIGGPSAGAVMTVATISLLENWKMDNKTIMTGMINPDASIGPIGGIPQKVDAAYSVGATRFLFPKGQGTYTEWSSGIYSTPVTKSVADYAMDNYDMQALEVAEIDEALEYFTGYTFSTPDSNGDISTTNYAESMEPLARHLLENASEMLDESWKKFNDSDIPNYALTQSRTYVYERIQDAQETLTESQAWYDKKLYYTSTSKSFQSLIASRFVKYACEYDEEQNASYLESLLSDVNDLYSDAEKSAKNAKIDDFISLQCVGAAQRRVTEAYQYLDNANNGYDSGLYYFSDVLNFLYDISFVVERCNSVGWWIDIGSHFNASGSISNETIEDLALEYIEEASQSAIYSGVLLDEMGSTYGASATYLANANDLIETARDNLEAGYPAAAFFEALEALVKANLAIEIIGSESEDKIDYASQKASSNIAKSRKQGVEPVLAVSYYEFAESLANESAFDSALMYYKYSGMIAGAISFTNSSYGTSSSRYIGIPEYKPPDRQSITTISIIVSSFILGGIAGLGLGLILKGFGSKKEEEKQLSPRRFEEKQIYEPQSLREYKKRYRNPYTSNSDMPRSIRDYYKKNK